MERGRPFDPGTARDLFVAAWGSCLPRSLAEGDDIPAARNWTPTLAHAAVEAARDIHEAITRESGR